MNYTSKDIKTLTGIEGIRERSGMYVGGASKEGMHQLLREVISNSIDEAINGYGTTINITIDKDNMAVITDEGRGVPFGETDDGKEAIIEICTQLHSGGKFGQGNYSVSGGLNGIGITAVNALSETFIITSHRDKQECQVTFFQGQLCDKSLLPYKGKNGTTVSFLPDDTIFKKVEWDKEWIKNEIELLSYLTKGITFNLNFKGEKITYLSKNGVKDLIKNKVENGITSIIYMQEERNDCDIEIALQYTNSPREIFYAFTNNIPNINLGTHVTGFKSAFTASFNRKVKKLGWIAEKDDNFTGEMIRSGMTAVVSIKMKVAPDFKGQVKEELISPEARTATAAVVNSLFETAIPQADLKAIFDKAIVEKKAVDAAKRAKDAANKIARGGKNMNSLRDLPDKLKDCRSRDGELFICEGDSAAGSAKDVCNRETQAILPLRGKVLNTYSKELAEIINNQEIKDILTTLGCGVGENFNIKNLRYDKIILMADADADGGHINCLLIALFLQHLPEIILQKHLYIAVPPLFRVKGKKQTIYCYSEEELKQAKTKGEITRFKGLGEMSPNELYDTTMNPATRKLIQLSTDNLVDTRGLFNILMGKNSRARKDFILANPIKTGDGEVYDEGEADE